LKHLNISIIICQFDDDREEKSVKK